ncbi:MAG: hypothetical protein HY769_04500 [Candidatus Stahlbacteria bacterium]|nr:hypothetical protein [Candidatus Stahlbacteria bacterium]
MIKIKDQIHCHEGTPACCGIFNKAQRDTKKSKVKVQITVITTFSAVSKLNC